MADLSEYKPWRKVSAEYPDVFPEKSLSWIIKQRRINGFESAVHRVGKNLLIHVPSALSWVSDQKS